jgi:hypothetical protein
MSQSQFVLVSACCQAETSISEEKLGEMGGIQRADRTPKPLNRRVQYCFVCPQCGTDTQSWGYDAFQVIPDPR